MVEIMSNAAGAVLFLAGKLMCPYTGKHPRIRRLYRIESWSGIFFCVAAFFLFYNGEYTRDSWAFTLAGGVLLVFTTIAIPRVVKKELKTIQLPADENRIDRLRQNGSCH